jgi:choice-of-anchor A domain-containing protein
VPVSAALAGLAPNTTYYYRVSASSAAGTATGAELSFKTLPSAIPIQVTDFNLFVLQKLSQIGGAVQGGVAAGGDATLSAYVEGAGLPNSKGARDDLIVGGNIDLKNVVVLNGNIAYGGTATSKNVKTPHGSVRKVANPLPIVATQSYVAGVAASWAALPANGSTSVSTSGGKIKTTTITLSGTDPTRNVFALSGADLAKTNNLRISVPSTSIVIVNISGADITLQAFVTTLKGADNRQIVYNFYQATKLTMKATAVRGTIWAPFADVSSAGGVVKGTLLAKSFTGAATAFETAAFAGPLP